MRAIQGVGARWRQKRFSPRIAHGATAPTRPRSAQSRSGKYRWSRGFTLMEILLVLALLAIVAAMVWPVVSRAFASYRLRAAADAVRTQWCLTRVEAMRSGHTYTFRYAVAGAKCRSEPHEEFEDWLAMGRDALPAPAAQQEVLVPASEPGLPLEQKLPSGVVFVSSETTADLPLDLIDPELSSEDADWSDPILFRPDGTTSDARLVLRNDRGRALELSLRGLTGTVTVGEMLDIDQLLP